MTRKKLSEKQWLFRGWSWYVGEIVGRVIMIVVAIALMVELCNFLVKQNRKEALEYYKENTSGLALEMKDTEGETRYYIYPDLVEHRYQIVDLDEYAGKFFALKIAGFMIFAIGMGVVAFYNLIRITDVLTDGPPKRSNYHWYSVSYDCYPEEED